MITQTKTPPSSTSSSRSSSTSDRLWTPPEPSHSSSTSDRLWVTLDAPVEDFLVAADA